ncbi:MAG: HzsA-related protein [Planctomycetota bacterium]
MREAIAAWFAGLLGVASAPAPAALAFDPRVPNELAFPPVEARYVRIVIRESAGGEPCIDELEVYGPDGGENLALASRGARASASSCLAGYAIHKIEHLNDGVYGNSHSWIAAGTRGEWAEIQLPEPALVSSVVFTRDREGVFADRTPRRVEVRVSRDGERWTTVARGSEYPDLPEGGVAGEELVRYAFACEEVTWRRVDPRDSVERTLAQFEDMLARFEARGLDVAFERAELGDLRDRAEATRGTAARRELFYQARLAKRRLFLRDPDLAGAERILFARRHPYEPSHNYSVILDAAGGVGGGVAVLEIPRAPGGRLDPARATVRVLFDAGEGISRDPVASFDGRTVYFGYRRSKADYFHLMAVDSDGGEARQLTDGPFHDYYPLPLPDGGLAFVTTRCKARFLCWRPQALVLFRLEPDGAIRPLSFANLTEWTPALTRDGRILWTRSEYLDKGADFGHTLWAIRPDGTHPELIFGNNTLNCYAGGAELPGGSEILCTLISHGGDLNGPLALVDPALGRQSPLAVRSITPDVAPHYHMSWARDRCFRDPHPISRDLYVASHAPADRFGLYLVDRYGNREVLYLDPEIGSMSPSVFRPTPRPHVLPMTVGPRPRADEPGHFVLVDVYRGLEPSVRRGSVKYIRVCQELRSDLELLPNGEYRNDHEPFEDFYASPTHRVRGPHGWPSYVAKGVWGLVPVEADGSASFHAPAGRVLYFQVLGEDLDEIQRMRSVVQAQPGEVRSCIGCHEDRASAPPAGTGIPLALRREPREIEPPTWGAGPFSYERVVQPVWDARCVRCHDGSHASGVDLRGTLDPEGVPASYRTLVERGLVHYFDYAWGREHEKAPPLSFGTVKSRLFEVLRGPEGKGHHDARLSAEELHRVKCWVDLNCPLWPEYRYRSDRPGVARSTAAVR